MCLCCIRWRRKRWHQAVRGFLLHCVRAFGTSEHNILPHQSFIGSLNVISECFRWLASLCMLCISKRSCVLTSYGVVRGDRRMMWKYCGTDCSVCFQNALTEQWCYMQNMPVCALSLFLAYNNHKQSTAFRKYIYTWTTAELGSNLIQTWSWHQRQKNISSIKKIKSSNEVFSFCVNVSSAVFYQMWFTHSTLGRYD